MKAVSTVLLLGDASGVLDKVNWQTADAQHVVDQLSTACLGGSCASGGSVVGRREVGGVVCEGRWVVVVVVVELEPMLL